MPFKMGPTELIIILVIVFLLFGASRLPQIGSSMGQALRGFKSAVTGEDEKKEKKTTRTGRKKENKA